MEPLKKVEKSMLEPKTIYYYEGGALEFTLTEDEIHWYIDPPPGWAPIQESLDIDEDILLGMYKALEKYFKDKETP
jgi:hypothetical protein